MKPKSIQLTIPINDNEAPEYIITCEDGSAIKVGINDLGNILGEEECIKLKLVLGHIQYQLGKVDN